MRIVRLTAQNIKRLKAVQVIPDPAGNLVLITGRNGAGKSSVLDAIWLALGGSAAARETTQPVRQGEARATVTVDLGDLRVTRTWKGERTELRVESADGARYGSPQAMLDSLVGRLSFDPLAFAQQDERRQLAALLDLIDLPFDLDDLDAERRRLYEERTVVGRERKSLEGQLAGMPAPSGDLPKEEVSTADLLREYRVAQGQVRDNDDTRGALRYTQNTTAGYTARVAELRRQLAEAEEALAAATTEQQALVDQIALLVDPDLAGYERRLADVEHTNAAVRAGRDRTRVAEALRVAREAYEGASSAIADLDATKTTAIRQARMPIDGLGFDEHGVTYAGVPFKQCSSAEQLRVSLAMAMALNPRLRVIRITDGSLLDSESMRLIEEMAIEADFQCWIERVDETGQVGVVIEDGQVAPVSAGASA